MKLLILLLIILTGCASYKSSSMSPDSMNYTLARDRKTGDMTDYIGVSWNLK